MLFLAKEVPADIFADAGLTTAIGLVVVFAMLVLLVIIFKAFGAIMSKLDTIESAVAPTAAAPTATATPAAVAAPAIVGNTAPVSGAMEIQNGITDETVAAIAGAVACMAPAGTQYAVRKIVKK